MKKKITQLRWLVMMLLLVTAMVMPLKAAAQTTHTYTVVGDAKIVNGVGWVPESETNRMTSTNGVTYTLEVKNAVLKAGNYEYKVCKDGGWSVTYPAVNNATLTIPADGTYDITYTYVVGDAEPSYSIKPSEGSSLVLYTAHYGLAGSEEKTELMLVKGSDGKWKSTIEGLTAGNYEIVVKGTNGSSYPESPVNFNVTIDNQPYEVSYDETTHDVIVNKAKEGGNTGEEGNGDPVPSGGITIYAKGAEAPYIYARVEDESGIRINIAGNFPGTQMTESTTINSENFWYYTISGYSSFNYILNNGNIYGEIKQSETQLATGDRYHGEGTIWADITATMIPAYTDITLAANSGSTDYWGTYSNMSSAAQLSAVDGTSLKVYDAKVSGGVLTLIGRTSCDVALGEGVLVWSNGAKVRATAITDKLTATVNTDLVATPSVAQTKTADDGYKLYRLTYNDVESKTGLGFYLGLVKDANGTVISDDGKKLKATPGKAYLKVSTEAATTTANAAPARGFVFPGDDETTGIGESVIEGDAGISGSANADGRIYNLQGQQVTTPVKGLYIKNNKKVIIK